jgi:hypothetical protein
MPVAVTDLVMDIAITNFAEQRCEVLYSAPSHQPLTVDEGRTKRRELLSAFTCVSWEKRAPLCRRCRSTWRLTETIASTAMIGSLGSGDLRDGTGNRSCATRLWWFNSL